MNPMLKQMIENNPGIKDMLMSPETMSMLQNPELLQQSMNMMQGMGIDPN